MGTSTALGLWHQKQWRVPMSKHVLHLSSVLLTICSGGTGPVDTVCSGQGVVPQRKGCRWRQGSVHGAHTLCLSLVEWEPLLHQLGCLTWSLSAFLHPRWLSLSQALDSVPGTFWLPGPSVLFLSVLDSASVDPVFSPNLIPETGPLACLWSVSFSAVLDSLQPHGL